MRRRRRARSAPPDVEELLIPEPRERVPVEKLQEGYLGLKFIKRCISSIF
jgi:hypothetical protein